jgi:hypothetical protein
VLYEVKNQSVVELCSYLLLSYLLFLTHGEFLSLCLTMSEGTSTLLL